MHVLINIHYISSNININIMCVLIYIYIYTHIYICTHTLYIVTCTCSADRVLWDGGHTQHATLRNAPNAISYDGEVCGISHTSIAK